MPHVPSRWGRQPAIPILTERYGNMKAAARAIGLNYNHLYGYLTGHVYPKKSVRVKLAEATGLPESYLFTHEVINSPQPICGAKPKPRAES